MSTEPVEPSPPTLLVEPEVVARRLGVGLPLPATQRQTIVDAILDAQADAEDVVNRPLFAAPAVLEDVTPAWGAVDLSSYRAWPVEHFDDWVTVVEWTPRPGTADRYDVRVLVGLNGPAEATLLRWVTAHAVEGLRNDPGSGMGVREVRNVAADGQSVSYAGRGNSETGAVGTLPTRKSLHRLRRVTISKRNRSPDAVWPYSASSFGRRW